MNEYAVITVDASGPTLDFIVAQWLHAKSRRSDSERTRQAYTTTMADFRRHLAPLHADLDSAPQVVATVAQVWAFQSADGSQQVSAATANQRLAILSSFYQFAQRQHFEVLYRVVVNGEPRTEMRLIENPIIRVERSPVQRYANARPLSEDEIHAALAAIDTTTPLGKRDYALILLGIDTGRRLSELRMLDYKHLTFSRLARNSWALHITWPRAKGNKVVRNTLGAESPAPEALRAWLSDYYGKLDAIPADAPVWVSLSPFHPHQRLSVSAMAYVCGRRIGTTKVHTLRHTFAYHLERTGAPISVIQAALGHANIQTTGQYLQAVRPDENSYLGKLEEIYGVRKKGKMPDDH